MGYTHYWMPKPIHSFTWKTVESDMRKLFAACDTLCGEYDAPESAPVLTEDLLAFNGKGELGHETFWIDRGGLVWTFCKTAQKPYDTAVTACLIYLASLHGFHVTSDGDESDWQAGLALARKVWPELSLEIPSSLAE